MLAAGVSEPAQKGNCFPDPRLWTAKGTCPVTRLIRTYPPGRGSSASPIKSVSRCREQARRVYDDAVLDNQEGSSDLLT